jgi:hypothetical protein
MILSMQQLRTSALAKSSIYHKPNKRFKSFASLSGTACRSPLTKGNSEKDFLNLVKYTHPVFRVA